MMDEVVRLERDDGNLDHPHFVITEQMEAEGKTPPPCGSGTVFTQYGALRLFCGRKDCPICFAWRKNQAIKRIRGAIKATVNGDGFWCTQLPKDKKMATFKRLYREGISYCAFPQQDYVLLMVQKEGRKLLEEAYEFSFVPDGKLEDWLTPYLDTPDGERVSFSRNFPKEPVEPRDNDDDENKVKVPKLGKVQYVINMELGDFSDFLVDFGVDVSWPYRSLDRISYEMTDEEWDRLLKELEDKGHSLYEYKKKGGVQIDP